MNETSNGNKQVNCIIVDDEAAAADMLESLLSAFSRLKIVAKISEPQKAITAILQTKPDLVFMDIQMPGMTGFEVLEALNHTAVRPFVIFITAFDRFAIQAIRASAFDFLVKPVDAGELILAIERFMMHFDRKELEVTYTALLEHTGKRKIRFNTTGGFTLVNPEDIVYIQADWNYSEIHLGKDKPEVVTMNLGSLEEILPRNSFARINRSVIINLAYLVKVLRGKRLCILKKDEVSYEFKIPVLRIRYLERLV
jgi:two-component system, LytTR family, response regulator